MSVGDARHSQSAIALNFQGESSSQRSYKRQREEIEHPSPAVTVSQASTVAITE